MVIYLDVLIFTNLFVNYFILKMTALYSRDNPKTVRLVLGAFIGALFSLYIFLPSGGILIESIFKIICSAVIILTTFGYTSPKSFLRRVGVFFITSFLYAGFMLGIWAVLKPQNLAINNGVVYINISPTVLIVATLLGYVTISLIRFFSSKQAYTGKRCRIHIFLKDKKATATVLIDTGHSLTDSLTGKPVVIIETEIANQLFKVLPTKELVAAGIKIPGFRVIPYSTVGGSGLLNAFVADRIEIEFEGKINQLTAPILAISKEKLGEDYKGIISPIIFEY